MAQFPQIFNNKIGRYLTFINMLGGRFAGEDQYAQCVTCTSHCHIRVKTIANHCQLFWFKAMLPQNSTQHELVGLAGYDFRCTAGCPFQRGTNRAAVYQNISFTSRAYPIRMRRDIRQSLLDPKGGTAKSFIGQGDVIAYHYRTGHIIRMISAQCIVRFGKLFVKTRGTKNKNPCYLWHLLTKIFDRCIP